ncbi:hypothetical protein Kpol_1072p34 [Vanderwaltozyma polyspora DSM 70294]|uniref:Mitochondrial 2-oxodicarboxylate carrier 1 n=1 Tax=Vanderwaltozyma polyspora (strain ATCC 22028 / DSM 70294 / BCRC 21397 / CBS 2163 / NBRC 10782 / NRRL Y-8283 / UCD 57-17) TaxID=436907 RepID=A7TKQ2_VANPO|nr:uncharacterized protein Kpol_1072p34 [Vanderwaltozyma polyspora DSM 70294]EDO17164.1 hypothetical protein Kpol_1072p34 [Vanderwaltozyma polyspora DSM 70294]
MSNKEVDLPFVYKFIAGAVAGISEILVMYPLDVVKTRMQLQVNKPSATGTTAVVQYNGVVDCISKIVKNEGFSRLYKGISSPILMEAPKRATKFACNDFFSSYYMKQFQEKKLTQNLSILSGASAGLVESFVVVPFELVKIRLQDVNSSYKGPIDVVAKIIRNEGLFAMYNGLEATMWRHGVWNAGYFGVIFQVRNLLPKPKSKNQSIRNDLIAGTIGGTVGSLLNTPFDVVKSRIQNTKVTDTVKKYNWSLPSILTIYKEEGFRALYKGFVPKVLRLGPGGGILLVVFTGVMDFFKKMHQ